MMLHSIDRWIKNQTEQLLHPSLDVANHFAYDFYQLGRFALNMKFPDFTKRRDNYSLHTLNKNCINK